MLSTHGAQSIASYVHATSVQHDGFVFVKFLGTLAPYAGQKGLHAVPPPKRRTTPLGGTLGAQWTDSITHVPIVVPPLPDQDAMNVAGSYGDLVAHATCIQEVELLPPLRLISALPELVGIGSGMRVAFRNPFRKANHAHKE